MLPANPTFNSLFFLQVIAIKDIIRPPKKETFNDVYIVYELMDTDLHHIIRSDQPLTDDHCQVWINRLCGWHLYMFLICFTLRFHNIVIIIILVQQNLVWFNMNLILNGNLFCSTFCISCYEGWSTCILPMFCTVTLSQAVCFWMQSATLRSGTLDWQGPPPKQISWPSTSSLVGTEHQSCFSTAPNTLLPSICGLSAAYSEKLWQESLCFQAKITFISWDSLLRYSTSVEVF